MRFFSIGGLFVVLAASAAVSVSGCSKKSAEGPPPKAPDVQVSEPILKTIVDFEEFTGRTDARDFIEVRARVKGDLVKVNFEDGAIVNKGDVLFEIEPKQYKAELERAKANLIQSQVRLKRLNSDFQRAANLLLNKSISVEEF